MSSFLPTTSSVDVLQRKLEHMLHRDVDGMKVKGASTASTTTSTASASSASTKAIPNIAPPIIAPPNLRETLITSTSREGSLASIPASSPSSVTSTTPSSFATFSSRPASYGTAPFAIVPLSQTKSVPQGTPTNKSYGFKSSMDDMQLTKSESTPKQGVNFANKRQTLRSWKDRPKSQTKVMSNLAAIATKYTGIANILPSSTNASSVTSSSSSAAHSRSSSIIGLQTLPASSLSSSDQLPIAFSSHFPSSSSSTSVSSSVASSSFSSSLASASANPSNTSSMKNMSPVFSSSKNSNNSIAASPVFAPMQDEPSALASSSTIHSSSILSSPSSASPNPSNIFSLPHSQPYETTARDKKSDESKILQEFIQLRNSMQQQTHALEQQIAEMNVRIASADISVVRNQIEELNRRDHRADIESRLEKLERELASMRAVNVRTFKSIYDQLAVNNTNGIAKKPSASESGPFVDILMILLTWFTIGLATVTQPILSMWPTFVAFLESLFASTRNTRGRMHEKS